MIRLFKLQRPLILVILGILAYVASRVLDAQIGHEYYLEEVSGFLLMAGALWTLYPIIFAKKDSDGNVEIATDPSVKIEEEPKAKPIKE